jgi:ubiquitin carboxyl-terminal hydrolase 5/13
MIANIPVVDIPILLPSSDQLVLDSYLSQSNETELPSDSDSANPGLPQFNEAAMAQLEGMGFSTVRCQKVLLATGNSDAEAAMEWLFGHMEDSDINEPIQLVAGAGTSGPGPSQEQIAMSADMGFSPAQARKALRETVSYFGCDLDI